MRGKERLPLVLLWAFFFFSFLTYFCRSLLFYSLTVLHNLVFIITIFLLYTIMGIVTNWVYFKLPFYSSSPCLLQTYQISELSEQYVFHCINLFILPCGKGICHEPILQQCFAPSISACCGLYHIHWIQLTCGYQTGRHALGGKYIGALPVLQARARKFGLCAELMWSCVYINEIPHLSCCPPPLKL